MKFLERWHVECDFKNNNGINGTSRWSFDSLNKAEFFKQEMLENPYKMSSGHNDMTIYLNPRIRLVVYEDIGTEEKIVKFGKIYADQEINLKPSY